MLQAKGIKHTVLNAKNHEREAEIVAQAGKQGAVTIATNMAGRGTDIMLGGNAETMALAEMRKKYLRHEVEDRVQKGETDERVAHDYIDHMIYEANGHADTDDARRFWLSAPSLRSCTAKYKTADRRRGRKGARGRRPVSSSAPSAMNPAESTTSCAAVPAVRATPANPASTFRWRTTSCVCSAPSVSRT